MILIDPKYNKKFAIVVVLMGFGTYYLMFSYLSLPDLRHDPDYYMGKQIFPDPDKYFTFNPFDDHISNIENIMIHLCLFFGAINLFDIVFENFAEKTKKEKGIMEYLVEKFL